MSVAEGKGEFAQLWIIFETFEIFVQAIILCLAKPFETGVSTPEVFRAVHLPHDFSDLFSVFIVNHVTPLDA